MNFSINECLFMMCRGYFGGVIYLDSLSPWIIINRCRFEMNNATYGYDIYVYSHACFTTKTVTSSCSTFLRFSVSCVGVDRFEFMPPCSSRTVLFLFFFFFRFIRIGAMHILMRVKVKRYVQNYV